MPHLKILSLSLLSSVLVLAGCTLQPTTESASGGNTNTANNNANVEVVTNTNAIVGNENTNTTGVSDEVDTSDFALGEVEGTEVDTSDWLTYTNEDYGFSFKYPENYSIEVVSAGYELRINNTLGEDIKFYKQYYSEAGTKDTLLSSKESLADLKEESELKGKSNANNVIINSYYSYSIPGGNFYKGADFFLGSDYVRMSLSLSTGSQITSNETEKIDAFIKILSEGNGLSANEEQLVKVFDGVTNTISIN